ncbi:MAG: dTDP-4-dehydrorhamnose 3,5-epimerase [Acidobacteria bacterium]|nr:dTDP-4-dehydrorhamnose 3,5-epimerase [Acidobacteriota bacterium]MBI3655744.1 dTDP-4-dehydrorhamnose 3,5-epimerase [Acidobacteriota bacterium]
MNFRETRLDGLWIVEPDVYSDYRGFFMEIYNQRAFAKFAPVEFVQDNMSRSIKGTLRGLHYQVGSYAQGKLVRVTHGAVFDVAVDIRRASKTFGQWFGLMLSAENKLALYIGPGFAHGFLVISDVAEIMYKCTNFYEPQAERCIIWNDPDVGIEWPNSPDLNLCSSKDRTAPLLRDAEID